VEQLYPWPAHKVAPILKQYSSASEVFWVQEEPKNMGAWMSVRDNLAEQLGSHQKLTYVGRGTAAAPAVGSAKIHEKEQKSIVEEALK
jgi:2-oxoglutarate dehydrogenase complex dehydrogenase (E1) component-like enzyme